MIPTVESFLPDLEPFITGLAGDHISGALTWEALADRVRAFFTPERLERTESVIPGWRQMAASGGRQETLIHVMSVLVALAQCPEYRQAAPESQALLKWIVLFHDVAKIIRPGQRDPTHAFRSAVVTGGALPALGFPLVDGAGDGPGRLNRWADLTAAAVIQRGDELIQDNRRLPGILAGIAQVFGQDTPAALIITTVLLHMSINNLTDWPQAAPLSDTEIPQVIRAPVVPLLEIMMLADSDAWHLFEPDVRVRYRAETRAVFRRVRALVG
ncbi:MAG: hypothetical protein JXQ72_08855 [Anaerolineae bacterium]|nr:hypothetical protein [Anaerolineae bacterium]